MMRKKSSPVSQPKKGNCKESLNVWLSGKKSETLILIRLLILLTLYFGVGCGENIMKPEESKEPSNDWFPLSIGNRWEYSYEEKAGGFSSDPPKHQKLIVEITNKEQRNDRVVYHWTFTRLDANGSMIESYAPDKLYAVDLDGNVYKGEHLMFPAAQDSGFQGVMFVGDLVTKLLPAPNQQIITPAGTFSDCITYKDFFEQGNMWSTTYVLRDRIEHFAKGVGCVKYRSDSAATAPSPWGPIGSTTTIEIELVSYNVK